MLQPGNMAQLTLSIWLCPWSLAWLAGRLSSGSLPRDIMELEREMGELVSIESDAAD